MRSSKSSPTSAAQGVAKTRQYKKPEEQKRPDPTLAQIVIGYELRPWVFRDVPAEDHLKGDGEKQPNAADQERLHCRFQRPAAA